jgi:hypothetical protein
VDPKNLMELGLSKDEDEYVRRGAELYKAVYIETIDNVFHIAKSIDILRKRHLGSGVQGAFSEALIQYGFTSRDPDQAMDKGIRSNLKEILDHEKEVRAWWDQVDARKKRDWLSARTIYRRWKASTKKVDPNKPKKPAPIVQLKETNQLLQEQLHAAIERLKTVDGGNLFDIDSDRVEDIGAAIAARWLTSPKKMRQLARLLVKQAEEAEARIKAVPVQIKGKGKADRKPMLVWEKQAEAIVEGHPRWEAAANGGHYTISPTQSFPSMKFAGYSVAFFRKGEGLRPIRGSVRKVEDGKAAAERDYTNGPK